MVHKKYIKRGDRVFGPYLYKNYRVNGKTKTKYLGKADDFGVSGEEANRAKARQHDKKKKKSGLINFFRKKDKGDLKKGLLLGRKSSAVVKRKNFSFGKKFLMGVGIIGLVLLLGILYSVFFSGLTGRATLSVVPLYSVGENVTGDLVLSLRAGELLPLDSKIVVENEGVVSEILISSLVESNAEDFFYVEGTGVLGEGLGYGFVGEKVIYPVVDFKLKISDSGDEDVEIEEPIEVESEEVEEEVEEESEIVDDEVEDEVAEVSEEVVEDVEEEPEEVEEAEPEEEEVEAEPEEEEVEAEPEEEVEAEEESVSVITGEVVKENKKGDVSGSVSVDDDFVYSLEEGESASVKKNSVKVDGKKIGDGEIDLDVSGLEVVVSTDYSIVEEGFGEDYLGDDAGVVELDLSELGIVAQEGVLSVKLVYGDVVLAEVSEDIVVEGVEVVVNVTEVNVTDVEVNVSEVNETVPPTLNVTKGNVTTKQYKAVINKPVKWIKKIKIENISEVGEVSFDLPKEAVNITVLTGGEIVEAEREAEEEDEIVEEVDRNLLITGQVVAVSGEGIITKFLSWIKRLRITGQVIQEEDLGEEIVETADGKIVDVDLIVEKTGEDEIAVEYFTPGPVAVEEKTARGKKVVVSDERDLNYTNVLAYSLIDGKVQLKDLEKIKIYHVVEEEFEVAVVKGKKEVDVSIDISNEDNVIGVVDKEKKEKKEKKNKTITGAVVGVVNKTKEKKEKKKDETYTEIRLVRKEINFTALDLDEDGYVDYIEWEVEHLSEQTYELIIEIKNAEHLDGNRSFISNIYESVRERDGVWSEVIPGDDYVRVWFEQKLDKRKDITVFARVGCEENSVIMINGIEIPCEIYEKKRRIDEIRREING